MEAARPRVSAVRHIRNNGSKPVLSTGHCLFHYCRRRAPGENQPPRRSQTPRTEPPLGNRGHTLGHGEIYRPASEQMALNLRCPFYTLEGGGPEPAPGSNRGTSGEAFTLDPRFRGNDDSKWSKTRHIDDLVLRSHQYRGSPELTARLKGQLRWQGVLRPGASEWRQSAVSGHTTTPAGAAQFDPSRSRVSPSKSPERGRLKLPQSVKVGHPGRANKGGACRMDTAYRGCAFRNAVKGGEHG
jgi:hypothetical protein